MAIYIYLFLILALFSCWYYKKEQESKKLFWVLSVFMLILVATRTYDVGTDTRNYVNYFLFPESGYNHDQKIELGFSFLIHLTKSFYNNAHFFLILNAIISLGCIFYFIYKNSSFKIFSLYTFATLGIVDSFYFFYFSGLRQSLALGFSLLLINLYNQTNKINWKILLLYLISCLFHITALVILPVLVISKKMEITRNIGLILIILTIFLGGIISNYSDILAKYTNFLIGDFAQKGQYFHDTYKVTMYSNIIPLSLICGVILWFSDRFFRQTLYFKIFFIGILVNNLLVSFNMAFRMVFYFIIVSIVVIPNFIKNNNYNRIFRLGTFILILIYFFYKQFMTLLAQNIPLFMGNRIIPYKSIITILNL